MISRENRSTSLEKYNQLILAPKEAVELSEVRDGNRSLVESINKYITLQRSFRKALHDDTIGNPEDFHKQFTQLESQIISSLKNRGIDETKAERFFQASVLVQKSKEVEREYELQKIEARESPEVRKFVENALMHPAVRAAALRVDNAEINLETWNYSTEAYGMYQVQKASLDEAIHTLLEPYNRHAGQALDLSGVQRISYIAQIDVDAQAHRMMRQSGITG